ncbi:hypothetical protein RFI_10627, partial [Reticulomyxa filosa]
MLIFVRTHRVYDITHDTVMEMLSKICSSRQGEGLADLSVQVVLTMMDLLENEVVTKEDNVNASVNVKTIELEKNWVQTWQKESKYRNELWKEASKLIPKQLTSLKMLTPSQTRLLLRLYYQDQSQSHVSHTDHSKQNLSDCIDPSHHTVHSLQTNIESASTLLSDYVKQFTVDEHRVLTSVIGDKKMWLAFLDLYCRSTPEARFLQYAKLVFRFVNYYLAKPLCLPQLVTVIEVFLSFSIASNFNPDLVLPIVFTTSTAAIIAKAINTSDQSPESTSYFDQSKQSDNCRHL